MKKNKKIKHVVEWKLFYTYVAENEVNVVQI